MTPSETTDEKSSRSYWGFVLWPFVLLLLGGCTVEHGGVYDFASAPMFELRCGRVELLAWPSSTVLHVGGTYYFLSLPFYVPLLLIVALVAGVLFVVLRGKERAREKVE